MKGEEVEILLSDEGIDHIVNKLEPVYEQRWPRIRMVHFVGICFFTIAVLIFVNVRSDENDIIAQFQNNTNITVLGDFIPPYIIKTASFLVDDPSNLATCLIGNSMEQLSKDIFCYLKDTANSTEPCDTVFTHLPEQNLEFPTNYTAFVFIRDPIDRFANFYMNNCARGETCFGCRDNVTCVVEQAYQKLMEYTTKGSTQEMELLEAVVPLTWNCNFTENFKMIKKVVIGADKKSKEAATKNLLQILEDQGVPDNGLQSIIKHSIVREFKVEREDVEERRNLDQQIANDRSVRDYLHRMYFYDYLIFNLPRGHLDKEFQPSMWSYHSS